MFLPVFIIILLYFIFQLTFILFIIKKKNVFYGFGSDILLKSAYQEVEIARLNQQILQLSTLSGRFRVGFGVGNIYNTIGHSFLATVPRYFNSEPLQYVAYLKHKNTAICTNINVIKTCQGLRIEPVVTVQTAGRYEEHKTRINSN